MIKKALTTSAVLAAVLGGVVIAAPAASADTGDCRDFTGMDTRAIQLSPCYVIPSWDGSTIEAQLGVITHDQNVDPCAWLVDLDNGQSWDYGCAGWVNTGPGYGPVWSQPLPLRADFGHGHYVVEEGYWEYNSSGSLQYYDNVESPVVIF